MGNLGLYQWFATAAKKVGGPLNLMGIIAFGGYAVIRTGEAGAKKIVKLVKSDNKEKSYDKSKSYPVYKVVKSANIEEGVDLKVGDKIKVWATDKQVALIEILGDKNNPYFIDFTLLKSIVNYK